MTGINVALSDFSMEGRQKQKVITEQSYEYRVNSAIEILLKRDLRV